MALINRPPRTPDTAPWARQSQGTPQPALGGNPLRPPPANTPGSGSTAGSSNGPLPDSYQAVKKRVQQRLVNEVHPGTDLNNPEQARLTIEPLYNDALTEMNLVLSRAERGRLFDIIMAEILGYGPIQPYLDDASITEVMVNGPRSVWIERKGKLEKTQAIFDDNDHVMRIIERIVAPLGRRIDESSPMVDGRLPDGSRVNVIIQPLSLVGPVVTVRKFAKIPLTVDDLVKNGTFTREFAMFAEAAVKGRLNTIISGGTGSGKTTLLNVLSAFIPWDERIVTIEDSAELQLKQEHVVRLEARPANIEGKGRVTIRDLVVNALRMRPDRIVVGEVRSGEALDMLQAMNTGHDGSLTTAHSNSPRDTLARVETMVLMAGMEMPLKAIRQQISSAVDLIIHQERLRDGTRKVVKVSEVQGMEGDTILMQDIFEFVDEGYEGDKIKGQLQPTGIRPKVMEKIEAAHIDLPYEIFGQKALVRHR
ncbi:MAG: CpaF family protein [Anaerolineae bacterium]|nr:CpaF family protein [Anaerolineae bacterium]